MPVGLQEHEAQEPPVLGGVGAAQRVRRHPRDLVGRGCGGKVTLQRRQHVGAERPHRAREQRHVDDRRLTRLRAPEQRAGDPERELHARVAVAEPAALVDGPVERRGRQGGTEAAPRPERGRVVGGLVGVGPSHAEPVAPRVDEPGVDGAQLVDTEPEAVERVGEEVGEEHVGGADEPEQQLAPLVRAHVEADAALATVRELHRLVHAAVGDPQDPLAHEAAVAVAGDGVLDLDDVGAPVGEQRARHGDEEELRELHDAHAVEHRHRRRAHCGLPMLRCLTCWKARMPSTPRSRPSAALLVAARARVRAGVAAVHARPRRRGCARPPPPPRRRRRRRPARRGRRRSRWRSRPRGRRRGSR